MNRRRMTQSRNFHSYFFMSTTNVLRCYCVLYMNEFLYVVNYIQYANDVAHNQCGPCIRIPRDIEMRRMC